MDLFFDQPERLSRGASSATAPVKIACEAAIRMGWDEMIGSGGISSA
jgi:transketolase